MSDPRSPGDIPPDLPPEYAEAYRRGYERAYREAAGDTAPVDPEPPTRPDPEPEYQPPVSGPLFVDEYDGDAGGDAEVTRALDLSGEEPAAQSEEQPDAQPGSHDEQPGFLHDRLASGEAADPLEDPGAAWGEADGFDHEGDDARERRPGWFVPVLFVGLVLILVLGAYGIGRVLSSSVGGADVAAPEPDGVSLGDGGVESDAGQSEQASPKARKGAYDGPVAAVTVGGATASCQAPGSVDAAGNRVDYPPESVYDGDLTTAWRCRGAGKGQSLTLTLSSAGRIAEVGLVPGYAKTDPRNGVDRYAENNRLTRVRWTFADGSSVVQRLDGSPTNRDLQTMRIRPVRSDTVVLEVLRSTRGSRNTMAISEVGVARVSD